MNNLLIISYQSPPISSPPSDRIYGFAKYLPALDWKPFILTAKNPFPWDLRFDAELYHPLDALHVNRAIDLQLELAFRGLEQLGADPRVFFAFDETIGWIPHAFLVGKKLIERKRIDCILASHPPPSCLIIGFMLSMRCGIPLILDYRDGWNSWSGVVHPSSAHKRLEMWLEKTILTRSDGIVTVCDSIRDILVEVFPIVRDKKLEIVRNGFLSGVLEVEACKFKDRKIRILHAGSIYSEEQIRRTLNFFKGLTMLSSEISSLGDMIDVILTWHLPRQIAQYIRKSNLDSIVRIVGDMSRHEVWSYMKGVDYLLCIPYGKEAVTTKMYEYLAVRKPIINLGDEDGEAARLIAKYGVGATVRPDPGEIASFLKGLLRFPLKIEAINDVSSFSRKAQTEKLAMFLNGIMKSSKRRGDATQL